MAADSKPGSRTWWRALNTLFEVEPTIYPTENGNWVCEYEDSGVTAGVGATPEEAYVDYVEEHWCFCGRFPRGYPN